MSLINEALKKAQRERSGQVTPLAPPSVAPPLPGVVAGKRGKAFTLSVQELKLAITVLGAGGLIIAGVLYWQWSSSTPDPLVLGSPKGAKMEAEPVAAITPLGPQPTPPKPVAIPLATLPPVPKPEPTAQAQPTAKARPEPRILVLIDSFRVTGIRSAGDDSKVLMNDRVYRLNDIVDHALGVRLKGVTPHTLTFEDEQGVIYTKTF